MYKNPLCFVLMLEEAKVVDAMKTALSLAGTFAKMILMSSNLLDFQRWGSWNN